MIAATLLAVLVAGEAQVSYTAPDFFIAGEPYPVKITVAVPTGGAPPLPAWRLTAAAFSLDGVALGAREAAALQLVPGQVLTSEFDLATDVLGSEAFQGKRFRLGFEGTDPRDVVYLAAAEKGINFMELPAAQLGEYDVILRTSRGDIWLEMWPDAAPDHVRNFLDLAYTGFYDDSEFHRVIPGFMIQGGSAKPGRPAPRRLKAEFNTRRHARGVLSMARLGQDTTDEQGNIISAYNSATCEFFVMHAATPHLDGQYTGFGQAVTGLDVVDAIAQSENKSIANPRDPRRAKPIEKQAIHKAIVVKAPRERPAAGDEDQ